jgi:hypothetical protein
MLGQPDDEPVHSRGRHHEDEHAADELEKTVEPLEDDPDLEGPVEEASRLEPARW